MSEFETMKAQKDALVEKERKAILNRWQPIETAPRDGTIILAFAVVDSETGNWNMRLISWNHYREVGMGGAWSGWPTHAATPTHWMPLPDPPEAA